jgi:hypothetical protein
MRRAPIFLMSLYVGVGSDALAAEPPVPSTPVQQSEPAAAAAPPSTTVASADPSADSQKSDPASKSGISASQAKALRLAGYKPEVRNGQTLYCRREAQLGTRFESKVCGTAAEIERSTENSQELANRIQQKAFVKAPGNP